MPVTQHTLVARMREGVCDADWERFYTLYEKPILAFAVARSLNDAECQDVLQETMVKMLRVGFNRFDPSKGRFTQFLFHVAGCCVIDALRRRSRWQTRHVLVDVLPLDEQFPDLSANPAEAAERQSRIVLIDRVLDCLTREGYFQPKTVLLFRLVTFEQRDPKSVAKELKTSPGNVHEAKRAVLAKLRAVLQALDQGADLEEAIGSR